MESRVVPATGVTMFLSSPIKALAREDLPTFGFPTIVKRGKSFLSSSLLLAGTKSVILSRRSPVPLPLADEMANGSPRPSL
jgi:hypothetical protein